MENKVREILQRPFDQTLVKKRNGPGGKQFSYVEIQHYLDRLNEAFQHQWSLEIVRREQYEDQLMVEVKIIAGDIVKMGLGGAAIRRRKDGGQILSLADDFKMAEADAIKRAARLFGIGAELYADQIEGEQCAPPAHATPHDSDGGRGVGPSTVKGRVTRAQLHKLEELVGELGAEWSSYRNWVRQERGVNVEYTSRAMASELITALIDRLHQRRTSGKANGRFPEGGLHS